MYSNWIDPEAAIAMLVEAGETTDSACSILRAAASEKRLRITGFYKRESSDPTEEISNSLDRSLIDPLFWFRIAPSDEEGSGRYFSDNKMAFTCWPRGWFKIMTTFEAAQSIEVEEVSNAVLDRIGVEALCERLRPPAQKVADSTTSPADEHTLRRSRYGEADRCLFAEAEELLKNGKAFSITQVAEMLAHKAVGGGSAESKKRRLQRRFTELGLKLPKNPDLSL